MRRFAKFCLAMGVAVSLLQLPAIQAAFAGLEAGDKCGWGEEWQKTPSVTGQPRSDAGQDIAQYCSNPAGEHSLPPEELVKLLRKRIKYVFVIFNENHSFDNEFGSFPGVNGLYSDGRKPRSSGKTPGFTQTYTERITGQTITVQPFRIGPGQNSTVVDSVDHSHKGLATKLDVVNGSPKMDKFAYDEYHRFAIKGGLCNYAEGTQFARLVMSYVDCDTIPFFWKWASHFTIFDNIFATEDTPSTPNAVAMIAGQSGETQWVRHGPNGQTYTIVNDHTTGATQGPPLVNDPQPFYGSQFDTTMAIRQPAGTCKEDYADTNIASNLTFASLPLTFLGSNIDTVMANNRNPSFDLPDIRKDIPFIKRLGLNPVNWRWYQEGYDLESTDSDGVASHNSYVSHHQGPQYFGYLANTPPLRPNLRGLTDLFNDIANNSLPKGGVF
ncbi:MAG TPA: alkaline phosphatase family protein, partial [Dissulfurispiraceae bacterium]|nr:alkaline phosphatase family protein [Dissulfurispiraceae bacterium]